MEIIRADEMKDLTDFGKEEFEKIVLEGPLFKRIVSSIEDAALEGYSSLKHTIRSDEGVREFKVIQKALIEAGYTCEIKSEVRSGLMMKYTAWTFVVDWNK